MMVRAWLALSALIFIAAAVPAGAQAPIPEPWANKPAWLHFDLGRSSYASKDFGAAIVSFDRAISYRRDAFTAAQARLSSALGSNAAKAAGDSIAALLEAFAAEDFLPAEYARIRAESGSSLRKRLLRIQDHRIGDSHRAFIEVLLLALEYKPVESFKDSIRALAEALRLLVWYPEAEYWKGKVFMLEGELVLASKQYNRAFDMREALDVPDFVYEIQYGMADLYSLMPHYAADWEKVMERILESERGGDGTLLDDKLKDAMRATLTGQGFDRFMTLYRIEPGITQRANRELAEYYLERGRAHALARAAVAVNMILTPALRLARLKDPDYVWTGLEDFLGRAAAQPALREYLDEQEFDRVLFVLADALYVGNARQEAQKLWRAVSVRGRIPYAGLAARRLENPSTAVRVTQPGRP